MAVDILPCQFRICQEANGQFCTILTSFQQLVNLPSCITALSAKTQPVFQPNVPYRSRKLQMLVCPHSLHQMFGFYQQHPQQQPPQLPSYAHEKQHSSLK